MSIAKGRPQQDENSRLARADVGGRFVTRYDPGVALQICERLANGETLTAICRNKPGMPHPTTFRRWAVNNPDLARAYAQAIIISATSLEEEALDAAREIAAAQRDGTQVRAVEVKLGQLRWSAERRDPAKYGSKSQINVRVPLQINTTLDLGGGAAEGGIYTVEATQGRSLEQASQASSETPLVEEKPLPRSTRGKVVLTPPSGVRDYTPFTKAMKGIVDERKLVRAESDKRRDWQKQVRPGDEQLHLMGPEDGDGEETRQAGEGEDREALNHGNGSEG